MAVAHDDALAHQVIVNTHGIRHPHQEKVGIGREYPLHARQGRKFTLQPVAFLLQHLHPALLLIVPVEHLHGLLLRQLVDIIGIFNFVEDTYDVRRGKRHAQADGRTSPCLGERLQDNQVGKLVQARQEGRFFGKIIVRLVHNHQAVETVEQLHNLIPVQVVAGRVVGRTEEHQLRMLVGSFQHLLSGKLEMLVQQDFTIGHIVNLCRHQIHAVGRLNGYDIVPARLAKGPKHQVDGLITAIAQEDMLGSYTLQLGQILLQLPLQRIGIPVVGCIIGVLIGIKKD